MTRDAGPGTAAMLTPEELVPYFPQYEIRRMLGRGGMGAVYLARQISLNRLVAIKILPAGLDDGENHFTERFKNEAQAMAQLSHPGIVAVYDFGQTANGLLYIVMEYIEGTDVARMVARQGRLHSAHAMAITAHVCDALAYAHARGIIHRDIKPSNIMVSNEGVVKVADFGLAKVSQGGQTAGLTQSGMVMGTLHFMAPEALALGSAVDQRADIYAVGVMLYQMLTGKLPQGLFEMPSLQVPGLDPRYDGIVAKALREDRALRYQDAGELRHDLDAILTQPVVKVQPEEPQVPAAVPAAPPPGQLPKRSPGQPYRPPQPKVVVKYEKKVSPLTWLVLLVLGGLAAWLYLDRSRKGQPAGQPPQGTPATLAGTTVPSTGQAPRSPADPAQVPASGARALQPSAATEETSFVNSLGMKFVPVPITGGPTKGKKVLFSIWETRVQDYEVFVRKTGREWPKPGFELSQAHPALNVTWDDATAFCAWLTAEEQKSGQLAANLRYRLPSDYEWSCAIGIGSREDPAKLPADKNHKIANAFPWGATWPPPARVGNYSGEEAKDRLLRAGQKVIAGYHDGSPLASPVGSFAANSFGLYDLEGNAREWCSDWFDSAQQRLVLRGSAFDDSSEGSLSSTCRNHAPAAYRHVTHSFRVVLELSDASAATATTASSPDSGVKPASPASSASSTPPGSPVSDGTVGATRRVTDLMALVDVKRDSVLGTWQQTAEGLRAHTDAFTEHKLIVPYSSGSMDSFDFEVEFTLARERIGGVILEFPFRGSFQHCFFQLFPRSDGAYYGFPLLDGKEGVKNAEATTRLPKIFTAGKRHAIGVSVRSGGVSALLDGVKVIDWKGDIRRFQMMSQKSSVVMSRFPRSTPPYFAITIGDGGALAQENSGYSGGAVFHKIALTEFTTGAASGNPTTPQTSSAPASSPASAMTWTDTQGRSITATFKGVTGGNVLLEIAGKVTPVAMNKLSAESQKLARDLQAASQPKPQVPPDALSFGKSRYAYYSGTLTWKEAKAKAESLGGHLATITAAGEDAWVVGSFGERIGPGKTFWIGATQENPSAPWRWVTGEAFDFTQWGPSEPNNAKSGPPKSTPPYMLAYVVQSGRMGWNDISESDPKWRDFTQGYLVEWDEAPASSASVAPATVPVPPAPKRATTPRTNAKAGRIHIYPLAESGNVSPVGAGAFDPKHKDTLFVDVAAFDHHVIAVTAAGEVVRWGSEEQGGPLKESVPVVTKRAVACSAARTRDFIIYEDGSLFVMGDQNNVIIPEGRKVTRAYQNGWSPGIYAQDDAGMLHFIGAGSDKAIHDVPASLKNRPVKDLKVDNHLVALTQDGEVVVWGRTGANQLPLPAELQKGGKAIAIGVDGPTSFAVLSSGKLVGWGDLLHEWAGLIERVRFAEQPWHLRDGYWAALIFPQNTSSGVTYEICAKDTKRNEYLNKLLRRHRPIRMTCTQDAIVLIESSGK